MSREFLTNLFLEGSQISARWGGLLNRCVRKGAAGSTPVPSAIKSMYLILMATETHVRVEISAAQLNKLLELPPAMRVHSGLGTITIAAQISKDKLSAMTGSLEVTRDVHDHVINVLNKKK